MEGPPPVPSEWDASPGGRRSDNSGGHHAQSNRGRRGQLLPSRRRLPAGRDQAGSGCPCGSLESVGLTWVEFGIRESEPTLWAVMFVSVFVMNTAFAIDVYRTAPRNHHTNGESRAAAMA